MAAIVEERQEAWIKTAQRPNGEDLVQHKQGQGPQAANVQSFGGCVGMKPDSQANERGEEGSGETDRRQGVSLLLRIPTDGFAVDAHRIDLQPTPGLTGDLARHGARLVNKIRRIGKTIQLVVCALRMGFVMTATL